MTTNPTCSSYLTTSFLANENRPQQSYSFYPSTHTSTTSVNNSKRPLLFRLRDKPTSVSASTSSLSSLLSSLSYLLALAYSSFPAPRAIRARCSRVRPLSSVTMVRIQASSPTSSLLLTVVAGDTTLHVTRLLHASLFRLYTNSTPSITHASKSPNTSISLCSC